jgi:hypothetical protein
MPQHAIKYLNRIVLIVFAFTFYACDSDNAGETPSIDVSPDTLSFASLPPGSDPVTQEVTISNNGAGVLKITAFDFNFANSVSYNVYWDNDTDDEQVFPIFDPTSGNISGDEIINIESSQAIRLILKYTPDAEGANGTITFKTNDLNERNVTITIVGEAIDSDLRVNPGSLDFERVASGMTTTKEVTITNFGSAVANFNGFVINGSDDFYVRYNDEDPVMNPGIVPGLEPSASMTLQVTYTPDTDGEDTGVLAISTPARQFSVNLIGNSAVPCINILLPDTQGESNEIRFNTAVINNITEQTVTIESCGGQNLDIIDIRIEGDDVYSLGSGLPGSFPATLVSVDEDSGARPQRNFEVQFRPEDTSVYQAELVIESNDPIQEEIRIPILGRGTANACPVAEVAEPTLQALPLDIITLDASPSTDPDGPGGLPTRYEWTVISRPSGSTAQPVESFSNLALPANGGPQDDPTTPQAFFFVDFAGEYEIQLTVTDDVGFSAPSDVCTQPAATIFIDSLPDGDILVELSWTTPLDNNETDAIGTDVDLHLTHPNAISWNTSPYDCFYANPTPDWGRSGPEGNPSLDIDDTNGAGPETIKFNDPEFTDQNGISGPYRVGVHYYSDSLLGASDASIKVYLQGRLAGEWIHTLNSTNNFWETAGIIWTNTDKRVQEINRFYESMP